MDNGEDRRERSVAAAVGCWLLAVGTSISTSTELQRHFNSTSMTLQPHFNRTSMAKKEEEYEEKKSVLVLLSASVKRVRVSRMCDFFNNI